MFFSPWIRAEWLKVIPPFFCLLFLLSFISQAEAKRWDKPMMKRALHKKLHKKRAWIKLIHYDRTIFGGYRGQIDNRDFYLSKDGKTDPEDEMRQTLDGFFLPANKFKDRDDHPYCRYPARRHWLQKKLKLKLPQMRCPEWDKFYRRASAKSVSLVFSSYYLNSPQSAFGHTFLRLNKSRGSAGAARSKNELLDNGINYAAERTTNNPILFPLAGIFGWTDGVWTMVPYYYKVREYNDYELRDLWSYELELSQAEVDQLVRHLWEMGPTKITYYFFTENCSYHMLTALEAAAPRLKLIDDLPHWVIPADTTVALTKNKGLIRNVTFRPSVQTKLQARLKKLSKKEKRTLKKLIDKKDTDVVKRLSAGSKMRVLDAAIEYLEFKHPGDLLKKHSPTKTWKRKLLVKRAALKRKSPRLKVPVPKDKRPDIGHGSRRVGLSAGHSDENFAFAELNLRFAFHDLLDYEKGYPSDAQIEMGNWVFRYSEPLDQMKLDEFAFVKAMSLNTRGFLKTSASWHAMLGLRRLYDLNCDRCLAGVFEYGRGATWEIASKLKFTTFVDFDLTASKGFNEESEWRYGVGPRLHFYWNPNHRNKVVLESYYRFLFLSRFNQYFQTKFEYRHNLYMNSGIQLSSTLKNEETEAMLGYFHFF